MVTFNSVYHQPSVSNVFVLPSFPNPTFEADCVHLTEDCGARYSSHDIPALLYLFVCSTCPILFAPALPVVPPLWDISYVPFCRFIDHIVEHICRFAEARQPEHSESDFNIQTSQITGVVSELRTVSEDAIENSVRLLEEQDGRENVE
jgi:hypothetical protein